jgi:REP element-mobilizing transposase RayT
MNPFPTSRPNEPPLPPPLAYFLTWTTYGTWLPGDERGWVRKGHGFQLPRPVFKKLALERMTEPSCTLNAAQREIVELTVGHHCSIRSWRLHIVSCRTNHVHVVVTATEVAPETVRDQFKAWCTRKLKEHARAHELSRRLKWWTRGGSGKYIGDEESLEAVIYYVRECQ